MYLFGRITFTILNEFTHANEPGQMRLDHPTIVPVEKRIRLLLLLSIYYLKLENLVKLSRFGHEFQYLPISAMDYVSVRFEAPVDVFGDEPVAMRGDNGCRSKLAYALDGKKKIVDVRVATRIPRAELRQIQITEISDALARKEETTVPRRVAGRVDDLKRRVSKIDSYPSVKVSSTS